MSLTVFTVTKLWRWSQVITLEDLIVYMFIAILIKHSRNLQLPQSLTLNTYHDGCVFSQRSPLLCLLEHMLFPDINLKYIQSFFKDVRKLSIHCTTPVSILLSLIYLICTRDRSDQKWSISDISGLELPSLHLSFLIKFKSVYADL